jgi:hypothetical protein
MFDARKGEWLDVYCYVFSGLKIINKEKKKKKKKKKKNLTTFAFVVVFFFM